MTHTKSIFGVYRERRQVQYALGALKNRGFKNSQVHVMFPEYAGREDIAHKEGRQILKGMKLGTVIGLVVFLIAGYLFTFILMDATPTDKTLVVLSSGLFGLFFGAAAGTLVGIGTPKPASDRYANYIKAGGIVLSVHIENYDQSQQALKALEETNAEDITHLNEEKSWKRIHSMPSPSRI